MDKRLIVMHNLSQHYGKQYWWQQNSLEDWLMMILIQRTSSKNVAQAVHNLRPYMSVKQLLALSQAELEELVRPAGFYRQKAQRIHDLLVWFVAQGGSFTEIAKKPTDQLRKTLLALNGIGNETADVMLMYTFGKKTFVADTYAMRLFNRLGFGPYTNYAKMQADFAPLLAGISLDDAREWHALIDEHGKTQVRHAYDDHFLLQPNLTEDQWPPEATQVERPHDDPGSGKWRHAEESSNE